MDVDRGVFVVADGIGGLPNGDEASRTAVGVVEAAAKRLTTGEWLDSQGVFREANRAVVEVGHRLGVPFGTGTTLTVLQCLGEAARYAHIGDSALFLFETGGFEKITSDHTVADDTAFGPIAGASRFTPAQQKNMLTRCIGAADDPLVDVGHVELRAGRWLVLATDGLFKCVEPAEVAGWFLPQAVPRLLVERLIALVNSRGGPDNVTVIALRVDEV